MRRIKTNFIVNYRPDLLKMKTITIKLALLALFFAIAVIANAQKLPNVQQNSLRAPADIKIDGKAMEWGIQFQAYNKATDIAYTLSNDDERLYLIVQAKYQDVIDKILRGGITLTLNHSLNKKEDEHVAITYPVFNGSGQSDVTNMLAKKENEKRDANNSDVSIDDMNKVLDAWSKSIKVSGIKSVTDKDISVYNQEGIKAMSQFDKQLAYTYELAVPLKYLTLPNNGTDGFTYNIKINEPSDEPVSHGDAPPSPPMAITATAPTDFWGKYILAKK
jgi:hypothetical protein